MTIWKILKPPLKDRQADDHQNVNRDKASERPSQYRHDDLPVHTDIHRLTSLLRLRLPLSTDFGNLFHRLSPVSERNILDHGSIIGVEHEPATLAVRVFGFRKIDVALLAGRRHEARPHVCDHSADGARRNWLIARLRCPRIDNRRRHGQHGKRIRSPSAVELCLRKGLGKNHGKTECRGSRLAAPRRCRKARQNMASSILNRI
jgi:hypothetical protein